MKLKNGQKIFICLTILTVVSLLFIILYIANKFTKAKEMNSFKENIQNSVTYKANNFKNVNEFKKIEEVKGYITEDRLKELGGKYIFCEMMTYGEWINKGYETAISYDIDPQRMIWVLQIKYNNDREFDTGKIMKKPLITMIYDAETNDSLSVTWKSEDIK